MPIRRGLRDVAQRGRAEAVEISVCAGHTASAHVAVVAFKAGGFARPDLGHSNGVKAVIGLELAAVATAALGFAVKQLHARCGRLWQGGAIAQEGVKGRAVGAPFKGDEGGHGIGDVVKFDWGVRADDVVKCSAIGRNGGDTLRQNVPSAAGAGQLAEAHGLANIVF